MVEPIINYLRKNELLESVKRIEFYCDTDVTTAFGTLSQKECTSTQDFYISYYPNTETIEMV